MTGKDFTRLFIAFGLITLVSLGISSCAQQGGGPTGGAAQQEQQTERVPMGEQDRSGRTTAPVQKQGTHETPDDQAQPTQTLQQGQQREY